jgi:hypothetical protein
VAAGQTETIGQRFEADRAQALALPPRPFDPCVLQPARVDKYQTAAFDRNRYSVPRRWAFEPVTVKAYVDHVEIVAEGQVIARHHRSYGAHEQILDPLHYLAVLGRRPAALDHADVYRHWLLPAAFSDLRTRLEGRHGAFAGARQYIRVLQVLAEHPLARVQAVVERCLRQGVVEAEPIRRDVERLALGDDARPEAGDRSGDGPVLGVQVPVPDLRHFNQLLLSGEPSHV